MRKATIIALAGMTTFFIVSICLSVRLEDSQLVVGQYREAHKKWEEEKETYKKLVNTWQSIAEACILQKTKKTIRLKDMQVFCAGGNPCKPLQISTGSDSPNIQAGDGSRVEVK